MLCGHKSCVCRQPQHLINVTNAGHTLVGFLHMSEGVQHIFHLMKKEVSFRGTLGWDPKETDLQHSPLQSSVSAKGHLCVWWGADSEWCWQSKGSGEHFSCNISLPFFPTSTRGKVKAGTHRLLGCNTSLVILKAGVWGGSCFSTAYKATI